jgi:hypothetical protein
MSGVPQRAVDLSRRALGVLKSTQAQLDFADTHPLALLRLPLFTTFAGASHADAPPPAILGRGGSTRAAHGLLSVLAEQQERFYGAGHSAVVRCQEKWKLEVNTTGHVSPSY